MFKEHNEDIRQLLKQKQETQLEQQRLNWNKFSGGWKKWDDILMKSMKPIGDALIASLRVKGSEKVLDIASGTGEPGLTLSTMLPKGEVYGMDLSEAMVAIANENSINRGILNYKSQAGDAAKLPFGDNAFDHIICRFGIMFFPDLRKGLGEMVRVLKPGGKMALAVWAAPDLNPFISVMASTIMQKLDLPQPPADAPGIFRCAEPGYTSGILREVGLIDTRDEILAGRATFDSPLQYWDVMSDVAGPLMEALEKAPAHVVNEVRHTVIEKAGQYTSNGGIQMSWEVLVVTGIKM